MTASSSASDLGTLLGTRGSSIAWNRVLAFFLAWMLCSLPSVLFFELRLGHLGPASFWASYLVMELLSAVLLTALLVGSLRNIRGDVGAILVAVIAYTLLAPIARLLSNPSASFRVFYAPAFVVSSLFGPLFVLLGIAFALRALKPQWLAVWVGTVAGFALSSLVTPILMALPSMAHAELTVARLVPQPQMLLVSLLTGTIFTLLFEGVSSAMA